MTTIKNLKEILSTSHDNDEKLQLTSKFLTDLGYKTDKKKTKNGEDNSNAFLSKSIEVLLQDVRQYFQTILDKEFATKDKEIAALKADPRGLAEKLAEQAALKAELDALMAELRKY